MRSKIQLYYIWARHASKQGKQARQASKAGKQGRQASKASKQARQAGRQAGRDTEVLRLGLLRLL